MHVCELAAEQDDSGVLQRKSQRARGHSKHVLLVGSRLRAYARHSLASCSRRNARRTRLRPSA